MNVLLKTLAEWFQPGEWALLVQAALAPSVLPFAVLFGLLLAGMTLSVFVLARARAAARAACERAAIAQESAAADVASMRQAFAVLEQQLQELRRETAAVPVLPKPGFNLTKRSQALRLHRRGDAPNLIAAELDIPLQEVDLLLKVHRIVISNL